MSMARTHAGTGSSFCWCLRLTRSCTASSRRSSPRQAKNMDAVAVRHPGWSGLAEADGRTCADAHVHVHVPWKRHYLGTMQSACERWWDCKHHVYAWRTWRRNKACMLYLAKSASSHQKTLYAQVKPTGAQPAPRQPSVARQAPSPWCSYIVCEVLHMIGRQPSLCRQAVQRCTSYCVPCCMVPHGCSAPCTEAGTYLLPQTLLAHRLAARRQASTLPQRWRRW